MKTRNCFSGCLSFFFGMLLQYAGFTLIFGLLPVAKLSNTETAVLLAICATSVVVALFIASVVVNHKVAGTFIVGALIQYVLDIVWIASLWRLYEVGVRLP
jgi:hypothetical protein